jgi:hypothetical protein
MAERYLRPFWSEPFLASVLSRSQLLRLHGAVESDDLGELEAVISLHFIVLRSSRC